MPPHNEESTAVHYEEHSHTHVVPLRVYVVAYIALMFLMGGTVLAYYIHPNSTLASNVIALGIAVIKAVIVVLFFMQVRYSTRLTWLWASIGFILLIILFSTVTDYISRGWIPIKGWTP